MKAISGADSWRKSELDWLAGEASREQATDTAWFELYPRRTCYVRRAELPAKGRCRYVVARRIAPGLFLRLQYDASVPPHLTELTNRGALQLWRRLARVEAAR